MAKYCFYHSGDLDGKCSGAIVKQFDKDVELRGINYGEPFPWCDIAPNDTVYMVDFSLQPDDDMRRLAQSCHLIWIDHHKSAIEALPDLADLDGKRLVGLAGCELAWSYFNPGYDPIPEGIHLLGRYDVWDHSDQTKWAYKIYPFQMGARLQDTDPTSDFWPRLFRAETTNSFIRSIMGDGNIVVAYQRQANRGTMKYAFEIEWEGLRWLAVNARGNSQIFESKYDPTKHDGMLGYEDCRNEYWTVSLYSTKPDIDVSVIAKKHGGGGHRGAAGFQCQQLPWKSA